jgi:predicted transcriptional regulator
MAKLTVEFNDQVDRLLNDLSQKKGLSKVDVLRRAIALYSYVEKEAASDPDKRLTITKDGQRVTDIVLT